MNQSSRMEENQTAAQKQAAAKLALRKQLEKTLLQIPPPKVNSIKRNSISNPDSIKFSIILAATSRDALYPKSSKRRIRLLIGT